MEVVPVFKEKRLQRRKVEKKPLPSPWHCISFLTYNFLDVSRSSTSDSPGRDPAKKMVCGGV